MHTDDHGEMIYIPHLLLPGNVWPCSNSHFFDLWPEDSFGIQVRQWQTVVIIHKKFYVSVLEFISYLSIYLSNTLSWTYSLFDVFHSFNWVPVFLQWNEKDENMPILNIPILVFQLCLKCLLNVYVCFMHVTHFLQQNNQKITRKPYAVLKPFSGPGWGYSQS